MSPELRQALRDEAARLAQIEDPLVATVAVGDFFAAVDDELARIAEVRLDALATLRAQRWSYDRISAATGLSKSRTAQLSRDARTRVRGNTAEPS